MYISKERESQIRHKSGQEQFETASGQERLKENHTFGERFGKKMA